jgi:hypothetical membrane protein
MKENAISSESASEQQSPTVRLLLLGGFIGPLLFIVVFLIAGATRPGYSAWHHVVSSLSAGPQGWIQIANFIVCGVLVTGFAIGLRLVLRSGKGAVWGPILLGVVGLGLVGAGIFVTDPVNSYPPGAPTTPTVHGGIHVLLSLFVFAALIAACIVLARRFALDPAWRAWVPYSIATAVVVLVFFILTDVAAAQGPNSPSGLFQRISIIAGWVWIALLALRLLRKGAPRE